MGTIEQIVNRISRETPFSRDSVYSVFLSNGDEKLTRTILETSLSCNISTDSIIRAMSEPLDLNCLFATPLYKRILSFISHVFYSFCRWWQS